MGMITKHSVTVSLSDEDFLSLVSDAIARDIVSNYLAVLTVTEVTWASGRNKWEIKYKQKEDKDET